MASKALGALPESVADTEEQSGAQVNFSFKYSTVCDSQMASKALGPCTLVCFRSALTAASLSSHKFDSNSLTTSSLFLLC